MLHLLFEDGNAELKHRFFPLGKNIRKHLQATLDGYEGDRGVDGYKRLNNILSMENGIAYNEMKRIKNFFDNYRGSVNTPEYILNGGDAMRLWVNDTLSRATKQVKDFKDAKAAAGIQNAYIKPHEKDRQNKTAKPTVSKFQTRNAAKDIDSNNSIKYESLLRENADEDHPFYNYLSDYDCVYVFGCFLDDPKGKQNWGVLIDPNMYAKALEEYTRYGELYRFPKEKVHQWMGIIMKNSAILYANTQLAGHSSYCPLWDIEDRLIEAFGDRFAGIDGNDILLKGENGETTKEFFINAFDELGLYEWMTAPDGSEAWSDYGIRPIFNLIAEYDPNKSEEETLVLVNKIIDVYHQRGDLSSMFIKGGKTALTNITFRKNESKTRTIVITEEQAQLLRESEIYRTYGIGKFDLAKVKPIKNRLWHNKPEGGLWASPTHENAYTWRHYAEKERFAEYEDNDYFDFELTDNARIFKIEDLNACQNMPMQWDNPEYANERVWRHILWKKEVFDDSNHSSDWLPDFEKLKEMYDVIDFTCNSETYNALLGWDCDCILVMNPDVIKIVQDNPNTERMVKYLE